MKAKENSRKMWMPGLAVVITVCLVLVVCSPAQGKK